MLDNNGATTQIAAGGNDVYQFHANTGSIWRYTGSIPSTLFINLKLGARIIQELLAL